MKDISNKELNILIEQNIRRVRRQDYSHATEFLPRHVYLLTDFGRNDLSVLSMQGVVHRIARRSQCHIAPQLPPLDVDAAAFILETLLPACFPEQAVFVVVVDPGVGTQRRPVAIRAGNRLFVGPDNGVFSRVVTRQNFQNAVILNKSEYHLHENISDTYHGRDIFAAVAGHLASPIPIWEVGEPIQYDELFTSNVPTPKESNVVTGRVRLIDDFGSLVTDMRRDTFEAFTSKGESVISVQTIDDGDIIMDTTYVSRLVRTFDDGKKDELIALFGGDFLSLSGSPYMTIAVNMGSARDKCLAQIGDRVLVKLMDQ